MVAHFIWQVPAGIFRQSLLDQSAVASTSSISMANMTSSNNIATSAALVALVAVAAGASLIVVPNGEVHVGRTGLVLPATALPAILAAAVAVMALLAVACRTAALGKPCKTLSLLLLLLLSGLGGATLYRHTVANAPNDANPSITTHLLNIVGDVAGTFGVELAPLDEGYLLQQALLRAGYVNDEACGWVKAAQASSKDCGGGEPVRDAKNVAAWRWEVDNGLEAYRLLLDHVEEMKQERRPMMLSTAGRALFQDLAIRFLANRLQLSRHAGVHRGACQRDAV